MASPTKKTERRRKNRTVKMISRRNKKIRTEAKRKAKKSK